MILPFLVFLSFFVGFVMAALLDIEIRFSKKTDYDKMVEDYENKIKVMDKLIEDLQKEEPESASYDPSELFPAGFFPEYGIPRKLDEGGR